jgi:5-methyltetrahydrofolate--homocysteine methyltransferase
MATTYLEAVASGVVLFDGAMGTSIQQQPLTAADFGGDGLEGCNDHLVLTRPDIIRQIHDSFLEVGCDVISTCTFQATPRRLAEWGLAHLAPEINTTAARLARAACDDHAAAGRRPFVAGSMGPTGMLPSSSDPQLSKVTFGELREAYYEQAKALLAGGVDLLLLETMQDMLELKAAIAGIDQIFRETGVRVPVQAQVTLDATGRMLLGSDVTAALAVLEALPVDVIGLNCSTGPEQMREPLRYLAEHATRPISVMPNAGLPVQGDDGETVYPLAPAALAATLAQFVGELGIRVVGGCCGTTPAHLAAVRDAVRGARPAPLAPERLPVVASGMRAVSLRQHPAPLFVGERINAQGSRRAKRLLLADDYDGLVEIAREQMDAGAHVLDVCVAVSERGDEAEQMVATVRHLAMAVDAPLVIDSTDPAVIARALEHVPGRAIVNSINMENGRTRIDEVLPLVRLHGAAVTALTIDEEGMARTCERKLAVARRIHDIAVHEYGIAPDALIIDPLTFTLATGNPEWAESARETIEAVRAIKAALPGVHTMLGVSNVSFGLGRDARGVLNSVFLYHCVEAGLDVAIVNPADVRPYAEIPPAMRVLADDLVLNRTSDALPRFIAAFDTSATSEMTAGSPALDPTAGLSPEQKVHWMVLHRRKEGIEEALEACGVRERPVAILNEVLLPAMKEVGDRFGAGELILPFVLQSAEVMKRAVRHLEGYLERADGYTKGRVVLATMFGDVHDIGKSLVGTILSNNGYTVHDLGKQVPVNTIVEKAIELDAHAIGLSSLLVSTAKQIPLCVQELDKRGLQIPVLIGGAALNRRFGRRALFVEGERAYPAGVFYCKDAFEGLETVNALQTAETRAPLIARNADEARSDVFLHHERPQGSSAPAARRSSVRADNEVPHPPFYGPRVLSAIPLDEVLALIDRKDLFRLQWGARGSGERYQRTVERDFEPMLSRLTDEAREEGWLTPQAVYGYFAARASGNDLLVWKTPGDVPRAAPDARFPFPRQPGHDRLCLADYFRETSGGAIDVAAFQVVTVGHGATRRIDQLNADGEYALAYFTHGLAVVTAEATAEWVHRRIRTELGLPAGQGKRYSWGYGACPDLAGHFTLFELLPAAEALDMRLTSAGQLIPEESTAALVVHHPDARYYSMRQAESAAAETS